MTTPTLYLSSVEAEKHTVLCLTSRNPDDMDGEELDNEGIFIERYNGSKISHDTAMIQAAMNHTRNILAASGVFVVMK